MEYTLDFPLRYAEDFESWKAELFHQEPARAAQLGENELVEAFGKEALRRACLRLDALRSALRGCFAWSEPSLPRSPDLFLTNLLIESFESVSGAGDNKRVLESLPLFGKTLSDILEVHFTINEQAETIAFEVVDTSLLNDSAARQIIKDLEDGGVAPDTPFDLLDNIDWDDLCLPIGALRHILNGHDALVQAALEHALKVVDPDAREPSSNIEATKQGLLRSLSEHVLRTYPWLEHVVNSPRSCEDVIEKAERYSIAHGMTDQELALTVVQGSLSQSWYKPHFELSDESYALALHTLVGRAGQEKALEWCIGCVKDTIESLLSEDLRDAEPRLLERLEEDIVRTAQVIELSSTSEDANDEPIAEMAAPGL